MISYYFSNRNNQPYDADLEEFIFLLILRNAAYATGERHDPTRGGCPPSNPGMVDWKSNHHGSLDLPLGPGQGTGSYEPEDLGAVEIGRVPGNWGVTAPQLRGSLAPKAGAAGEVIYNRFQRVQGRYTFPPLFGSGAGLKTIADAVRNSTDKKQFQDRYGFDYDRCKELTDALDVAQRYVAAMQKIFPGSVFLDPNSVHSSNHKPDSFCSFVDNVLAQNRPSVYLRRPGLAFKASSTSPLGAQDATGGRTIQANDVESAMRTIIGLSNSAERGLQDRFIGHLTTLRAAALRLGGRQAAGVVPIQARLNDTGGALPADDDVSIFSPFQADSAAPLAAGGIYEKLPPFAQHRFERDLGGATNRSGNYVIYREATAPSAEAAALVDVKRDAILNAYRDIARLLINYKPSAGALSADDAARYVQAYKARAVVLSLLTLVNDIAPKGIDPATAAFSAKLGERFGHIIELLHRANVNTENLSDRTSLLTDLTRLDFRHLKQLVTAYFESNAEQALDTFGYARAKTARTAVFIHAVIDELVRKADEDTEAVTRAIASAANSAGDDRGTAPHMPRFSPDDYMRCDLRFSEVQFRDVYNFIAGDGRKATRIPLAMPADPQDNDTIVSYAKLRQFSEAIKTGTEVPASLAPTHVSNTRRLGSSEARHTPAVTNVRNLKRKGVLLSTESGAYGIPPSYEADARRAENYGVTKRGNLVSYEEEQRQAGAEGGRYRLSQADDMELDAPSYYRPNRPVQTGVPGSTACLRYSLDRDVEASNGFQELWDALDEHAAADPALAAVGKVYLGTPTSWKNWEALAKNNVIFPMSILLARPLVVFTTYSLYFILAGRETMITRFGQPIVRVILIFSHVIYSKKSLQTTWANESQRQVYSLTLVFKSKTSVINDKNIYHVPNAFIVRLFPSLYFFS